MREVLAALDGLTREELRGATAEELREFLTLLHHWHQLAEVERDRRRGEG